MKLPDHLFWDTDLDTLDFTKNVRFIIQRVIQKGTIEDWAIIKKYYGIDLIMNEILLIRYLDIRTLNFFSTYFGLDKNKFRCFSIQQSTPGPYNY